MLINGLVPYNSCPKILILGNWTYAQFNSLLCKSILSKQKTKHVKTFFKWYNSLMFHIYSSYMRNVICSESMVLQFLKFGKISRSRCTILDLHIVEVYRWTPWTPHNNWSCWGPRLVWATPGVVKVDCPL